MFWRGRKRKFWDGKTDLLIITYLAPQMHPSVHALQMEEFPSAALLRSEYSAKQ